MKIYFVRRRKEGERVSLRLLWTFLASAAFVFLCSVNTYAETPTSNVWKIQEFNQRAPVESHAIVAEGDNTIFEDVPAGYWAKEEIEFLYSRSIIQGYNEAGQPIFRPREAVTRAQAVKMLMKALGEEEKTSVNATFKDVPDNHWAAGWISLAVEKGILTGYSDGTFRPNDLLKRSQMSKIIALAFSLPDISPNEKTNIFQDVDKGYWAQPYVLKLYYNGITNGNQNRFMPEDYISRDQFSAFLARAMDEKFRLPVKTAAIATGKVTAQALNVRSEGNANASIVGKLSYGTVVNVYAINGYWAKISYGNISGYVHKSYLKLKNMNGNVLQGRIITVDAGHGGTDPGTIGNGAYEKNIVLPVAQKLKTKLENAGAKVVMTRESDTYPTLEQRVNIAKQNYAELFVSIHVNSGSPSANGTETYYDTSTNPNGYESYLLAKAIHEQIIANADMNDRGVKDNNFYVIRYNNVPSVLVELGFITNADDVQKLTSDEYQTIFAESIYQGIIEYYQGG